MGKHVFKEAKGVQKRTKAVAAIQMVKLVAFVTGECNA